MMTFQKIQAVIVEDEIAAREVLKNYLSKYCPMVEVIGEAQNIKEAVPLLHEVTPQLVFEIGFEGIALSKRHKSGVATRFPRILRWRQDKKIEDANSIEDLKSMIS